MEELTSRGYDDLVEGRQEELERELEADLSDRVKRVKELDKELEQVQEELDTVVGNVPNKGKSIAKGIVAPHASSREEREQHNLTHTPYRPWCKYCVKAQAATPRHRRKRGEEPEGKMGEGNYSIPRGCGGIQHTT